MGIEPFGGHRLSGTGPKAGGADYLLAFMARVQGERIPSERASRDGRTPSNSPLEQGENTREQGEGVREWEAPIGERLRVLRTACDKLGPETLAKQVRRTLMRSSELEQPEPTVAIPGQRNHTEWDTPRGIGVVAVDEGSNEGALGALVCGALLGGNGLLVFAPIHLRPPAQQLIAALHEAGVPQTVLRLAEAGVSAEQAAAGLIHFAAVDLHPERTLVLYGVLGAPDRDAGQRWLKTLITLSDGPAPGEAGFLRQFVHPKTVAVQTLRHGADLAIP